MALVPVFLCVDSYVGSVKLVGGRSMQPTFNSRGKETNDVVVLDRWSVRQLAYKRGDVVVLRSPHEPNELLTKRVVGLPGDWIRPRPNPQEQQRWQQQQQKRRQEKQQQGEGDAAGTAGSPGGDAASSGAKTASQSSSSSSGRIDIDDDDDEEEEP